MGRLILTVLMISKALVSGAYHGKLRELASLGVDLHVVVPPAWGDLRLEIAHAQDYTLHCTPIALNGRHHFHFYRGLSSIFRDVRPNLVHIEEEHYSAVTYQAMRHASAAGLPAIFFTWQNIHKRYPFPFSAIERYNFRHAAGAIAGNMDAAQILEQKGFDKPVTVIPQFGVDTEQFRPMDTAVLREELGLGGADAVIGDAGRLVEEKGVIQLVQAVAQLSGAVRLLLVGAGPQRRALEAAAKATGLNERIIFLDTIASTRMPEVLNCMDCLVLPSLTRPNWKEPFGRVLVEAMACGVPVIGSDAGEIPNVIGEAGLVVHEKSVTELTEALRKLLEGPSYYKEMAQRGRARVQERFTNQRIARKTFDLYATILKARER